MEREQNPAAYLHARGAISGDEMGLGKASEAIGYLVIVS